MEFEMIRDITAGILGVEAESVARRSSFTEDLGANSLDLFEILTEAEERADVPLDLTDLSGIRTVEDAVLLLVRAEKGEA